MPTKEQILDAAPLLVATLLFMGGCRPVLWVACRLMGWC